MAERELDFKTKLPDNVVELKNGGENALVTQDNQLLNGSWELNLTQTRLYLSIVSMIQPDDQELKVYKITAATFRKLFKIESGSIYNALAKDVKKIVGKVVELKTITPAGKEKTQWVPMLVSATYEEGNMTFKFSEDLKPYLLQLKEQFTQARLMDLVQFNSTYTIRFFLLCKQFESTGWRVINLDDLRNMLNLNADSNKNTLKKDKYKDTGDLKKRVIDPSILELNEKGYKVKYSDIKTGRKVTGFKFEFAFTDRGMLNKIELKPKDQAAANLLENLRKKGLSDKQIKTISKHIGTGYIRKEQLNQQLYALSIKFQDKVKFPPDKWGAYTYKVLKGFFNITDL